MADAKPMYIASPASLFATGRVECSQVSFEKARTVMGQSGRGVIYSRWECWLDQLLCDEISKRLAYHIELEALDSHPSF